MKVPTFKKQSSRSASQGQRHPYHRSFEVTMKETTQAMPRYKRIFSEIIHTKIISGLSDILGKTIARPNAILFGAIFSFSVTISVYLLSKNLGYTLSGFESIGSFLLGWVMGQLFDLVSFLIRKKDL